MIRRLVFGLEMKLKHRMMITMYMNSVMRIVLKNMIMNISSRKNDSGGIYKASNQLVNNVAKDATLT